MVADGNEESVLVVGRIARVGVLVIGGNASTFR